MSNNGNCNTVNIVNTDYKRENNIGTKSEMDYADDVDDEVKNLNFKHLILIGGKILLTQPWNYMQYHLPNFLWQKIPFTQLISLRYQPLCK